MTENSRIKKLKKYDAMVAGGMKSVDAAKKVGVSYQSVRVWKKRYKTSPAVISTPKADVAPEVDVRALALLEQNKRLKAALGELYIKSLGI